MMYIAPKSSGRRNKQPANTNSSAPLAAQDVTNALTELGCMSTIYSFINVAIVLSSRTVQFMCVHVC